MAHESKSCPPPPLSQLYTLAHAEPQAGATWLSTTWRTFGRYAFDASRLIEGSKRDTSTIIYRYLNCASLKADQCRESDEVVLTLWQWVHKFAKAANTSNLKILKQLVVIAEDHAAKHDHDSRKTDNACFQQAYLSF